MSGSLKAYLADLAATSSAIAFGYVTSMCGQMHCARKTVIACFYWSGSKESGHTHFRALVPYAYFLEAGYREPLAVPDKEAGSQ
jgi:hypothetical protein